MRLRILIPGALVIALVGAGAVSVHASADRQGSYSSAAGALRAQWDRDQTQGVPATVLAPLRQQLDAGPSAGWWSPTWLRDDGQALLTQLRSATQAAWSDQVDQRRTAAETVLSSWTAFVGEQSSWVDPATVSTSAQWPQQLAAASSPAAITALMSTWQATLDGQRTAVAAAQASQKSRLEAAAGGSGGPQALLTTARRLLGIAQGANLDAGDVGALATTLQGQLDGHGDAVATASKLLAAVGSLQALITLNNQVASQLQPLLWAVDQAAAEGTPSVASFQGQDASIAAQMRAARTSDQLNAVAAAASTLSTQVQGELSASQCGHAVGAGKEITLNLSLQEMLFFQDGCVVKAAPVSTGRPQLRTPTGTFSIFYKKTPFTFYSPWPVGSPFYYYPSPVSWVMEFANDGYFIHDAPWEAAGAYGAGSENNPAAASHGCVHVPTSVMQWAYGWTPVGTPVVISA